MMLQSGAVYQNVLNSQLEEKRKTFALRFRAERIYPSSIMQSIISLFAGLIVSLAGLLMTKGAIMSGATVQWTSLVGWVVSLWIGVFITAYLCPKKNATWLKSHVPPWVVATVVLVIGALIYGDSFRQVPIWLQFLIALAMSGGSMALIRLAPKLSKRPSS